jgi:hypothetical protein
MKLGPSRGRPLQLVLAEGDGEGEGQLDANKIDNSKASKRLQPQLLKRS